MSNIPKLQERYQLAVAKVGAGLALIPPDKRPPETGALAMRDATSLASLLLSKGVISEAEYWQAVTEGMEAEVSDTQELIKDALGVTITL